MGCILELELQAVGPKPPIWTLGTTLKAPEEQPALTAISPAPT